MIVAILPALDEEDAVGAVVRSALPHVDAVVVVDNGSRDATPERARDAGADVVTEPRRGYGHACLAGVERARQLGARVIVFLDADGSDDPGDLPRLVAPLRADEADLILGVRAPGSIEPGSMTPAQRLGNWLAPRLMRWTVGARYSDMPPFKALTLDAYDTLCVRDTGHGFTIELLLQAHARRLRVREIAVGFRRRAGGKSKVSGTLVGTVRASAKIVATILRHAIRSRHLMRRAEP